MTEGFLSNIRIIKAAYWIKISFNYEENEETHHPYILGGVQYGTGQQNRQGWRLEWPVCMGWEVTKGFGALVVWVLKSKYKKSDNACSFDLQAGVAK